MSLKMSPGHVTAVGGGKSATLSVTPTNRVFSAGDMSAQLTINRTRVQPQ